MKAMAHTSKTTGRSLVAGIVGAAVALLASLCLAAPASALEARVQYAEFGPDGTQDSKFIPNYIGGGKANALGELAFDQVNKRLYASTGHVTNRIYGFDASIEGVYDPLGGNFPLTVPGMFYTPLAVDGGTPGASGNIYTFLSGSIPGFDSSGEALPGYPVAPGFEVRGGTVDSTGALWVYDRGARLLRKYTPAGFPEGTTINLAPVADGAGFVGEEMAFDSNGDLYVFGTDEGVSRTFKIPAAGGYATPIDFAPGGVDIAVDTSNHNVYVVTEAGAKAYDSTGKFLYNFGDGIRK